MAGEVTFLRQFVSGTIRINNYMDRVSLAIPLLCFALAAPLRVCGQPAPNPKSDVLLLNSGEKLVGQLESATDSAVTFKSIGTGEVKVDWKNIRQLHSSQEFAVIRKGLTFQHGESTNSVPQGTLTMQGQQLVVQRPNGSSQTVPISGIAEVVPESSFQNAFHHLGFTKGWKGGATAGISLTEATQTNRTFSAAVNMARTVPQEDWLSPKSRTTFNLNDAYGNLKSPGQPAVKTSIFHLDAEQDWYLSPRLFAFGAAAFDHSISQGLDLQQIYGAGLGFVVFKRPKQELDARVSADYIDQRFVDSTLNKKLFGTIFGESYIQTFAHGILLNEEGKIIPAWNDTSAYSAFISAGLTFPVYHHFGLTVGALDNFLNDPPPGFRKNSFQFTLGATYSF